MSDTLYTLTEARNCIACGLAEGAMWGDDDPHEDKIYYTINKDGTINRTQHGDTTLYYVESLSGRRNVRLLEVMPNLGII